MKQTWCDVFLQVACSKECRKDFVILLLTSLICRGVAKPLWLRGCVHWIARICYFYKIARILLDALTTEFSLSLPEFSRFLKTLGWCDTPHTPTPLPSVATPLLICCICSYVTSQATVTHIVCSGLSPTTHSTGS